MRSRLLAGGSLLVALVAGAIAIGGPAASAQDDGTSVLKIGWAQDPGTLNPFIGYDEEDFTIWAIELGAADQLRPRGPLAGPGDRRELGRLRGQEDDHLPPGRGGEVVRR